MKWEICDSMFGNTGREPISTGHGTAKFHSPVNTSVMAETMLKCSGMAVQLKVRFSY